MRSGVRLVCAAAVVVLAACTSSPLPIVDDRAPVAATTPAPQDEPDSVTVAIDGVDRGFNPHLVANLSPVSQAVGTLVLPSAFRPAADGSLAIDDELVTSAKVTEGDPFTVEYQLTDAAQWSDGAPIAAEDFRYLWEQMISEPGVVDPAGYQLIDDVTSSGGGKTVTVAFSAEYPAWRELFTNLLPSHTLKDAPGGFASALSENVTFSGSRYAVTSVQRDIGEVQLERNDRFWGTPATLDEILLRRDGTPAQLAESLRTNDAQLALVRSGAATRVQIRAVPEVSTSAVPMPSVMQVAVDTADPRLADPRVRRGVLALLDPVALTTVGTTLDATSDPTVPLARAQILAPSQPGYTTTQPPSLSPDDARTLITAGGYTYTDDVLTGADGPLTLVLGADQADPVAVGVAEAAADQLTTAGIEASATELPAPELYGEALSSGSVDLVVGRAAAGGDLATSLASRFGCFPADEPASGPSATERPNGPAAPSSGAKPPVVTPEARTLKSEAAESRAPGSDDPGAADVTGSPRAGTVSGVCEPSIQDPIREALTGEREADEVVRELEPELWRLGAVLPLYQDSVLAAARPELGGLDLPGPLMSGPLAGAATWTKAAR